MYQGHAKQNFKSFASALAISATQALRKPRLDLFIPWLILSCAFLTFPVRAQECTQSIIFSDDFESDPFPRWTIGRESIDPSTFVARDWTWITACPTADLAQPSSLPTL